MVPKRTNRGKLIALESRDFWPDFAIQTAFFACEKPLILIDLGRISQAPPRELGLFCKKHFLLLAGFAWRGVRQIT